jgi:hypothetical protein
MKIVVAEPGFTMPEIREIDGSLESMQEIVGGYIEVHYPWDMPCCVVCNEEAERLGLPLNRLLRYDNGVYEVFRGTVFAVGIEGEEFASLTDAVAKMLQAILD